MQLERRMLQRLARRSGLHLRPLEERVLALLDEGARVRRGKLEQLLSGPDVLLQAGDAQLPRVPVTLARLLVMVGWAAPAFAQSTWSLTWQAPAECIQPAELGERVERRIGRPLFVAQAPRAVRGYLAKEPTGWRARFTLVDDGGTILGTRELEQPEGSCRLLDERLVFLVVVSISSLEPVPVAPRVEPVPQPPPPKVEPPPPPRRRTFEVRAEERLVDGRLVTEPEFYRLLSRWDLVEAFHGREALKIAGITSSAAVVLISAVLFAVSAAGADCVRWSGTPESRGVCLDRAPALLVTAITTLVAGGAFGVASLAFRVAPTTQAEDEALARAASGVR